MSYRIAHVRFAKRGQAYPVNCYRSDIAAADMVVVEMNDRNPCLQIAEVDRVEFLNWRCKNTIVCKKSEYRPDGKGSFQIAREAGPKGIGTIKEIIDELRNLGWQNANLSPHVYTHVFVKEFELSIVAIGIRRNGIDFQVYDCDQAEVPKRFPDGKINLVKHFFYKSELDLLEFCKRFALNAHRPFCELKKYFQPIGKKQPRLVFGSDDLSSSAHERDDRQVIRDLLGDAMTDTEREAFG